MSVELRAVFCGVPTFFRALCEDAARPSEINGSRGYRTPGYHLAFHAVTLVPHSVEIAEWRDCYDELESLLSSESSEAPRQVLEWFVAHFPACMTLVPKRRRIQFVQGVYDYAKYQEMVGEEFELPDDCLKR